MTITTSVAGVDYDGDGADVSFPTTFYFQSNSHVSVSEVDANGAETAKTEGAHYSLTGAGVANGGTVTMTTAPAVGITLRIRRTIPLTQPTAFSSLGTFSPAIHETAFDRVVQQVQQVQSSATDLMTDVRDEVVALRADIAADPAAAALDARTVLSSGSTTARTLAARFSEYINVLDYGVSNVLTTDQTTAFHAAITAAKAANKAVFCPAGTYYVNLVCTGLGVRIFGEHGSSAGSTVLRCYSTSSPCVSIGDGTTLTYAWQIDNVRFVGGVSTDTVVAGHKGLAINGAQSLRFQNTWFDAFAGDNVFISATDTQPTSYVHFDHFTSNNARRSCFSVEYSDVTPAVAAYVTAVSMSHFSLSPHTSATKPTAMHLKGVQLWMSDGWAELNDYSATGGHIYLEQQTGAPGVRIDAVNVSFDGGVATRDVFRVSESPSGYRPSDYLRGANHSVVGRFIFADATTITMADKQGSASGAKFVMSQPYVSNKLFVADVAGTTVEDFGDDCMAVYNNSGVLYASTDNITGGTSTGAKAVGLRTSTPAAAGSTGLVGQFAAEGEYISFCIATNTWVRMRAGWQPTGSVLAFGATTTNAGDVTEYLWPGYGSAASTTEIGWICPTAGVIRDLRIKCTTGITGDSIVFTVRKNATGTAVTATLAAAATTGSDSSNAFTVAAGDEISVQINPGAAITVGATAVRVSVTFTPS